MEQARQKTVWRRRWLLLGLLVGLLGGILTTLFFPRPWSRPSLPISIQLPPGLLMGTASCSLSLAGQRMPGTSRPIRSSTKAHSINLTRA